jgi:uncharacterized protein involved in oxidation of intracellular sulfur
MKTLIIITDPPYGTERVYNGLRLAHALLRQESAVTVFLMADAVSAARTNQKTPDGQYNVERMLKRLTIRGKVLLSSTCMDARGLCEADIVAGAARSSMEALASETLAAERVLTF